VDILQSVKNVSHCQLRLQTRRFQDSSADAHLSSDVTSGIQQQLLLQHRMKTSAANPIQQCCCTRNSLPNVSQCNSCMVEPNFQLTDVVNMCNVLKHVRRQRSHIIQLLITWIHTFIQEYFKYQHTYISITFYLTSLPSVSSK